MSNFPVLFPVTRELCRLRLVSKDCAHHQPFPVNSRRTGPPANPSSLPSVSGKTPNSAGEAENGLVAAASTTFDSPYHIARRFASLDHLSGGRASWNIVTTSNPDAALNFGMDDHMEHDERYRRAREF